MSNKVASKDITTFFPSEKLSDPSKRQLSDGSVESGLSPVRTMRKFDSDEIQRCESGDLPSSIAYLTGMMEHIVERFENFESSITAKIDRVNERFNLLENSLTKVKEDTTLQVQQIASDIANYKQKNDEVVSTLSSKVDSLMELYESEKKRADDLEKHARKTADDLDSLEQYGRRSCLLLHGVEEKEGENTTKVFIEHAKELGVTLKPHDISRSHRLGKPRQNGHRPIIAKFVSYADRHRVYSNKKKFKGSRKMITESLTTTRVMRLRRAIEKYESKNVWTMDGEIFVNIDGKKSKYTEPDSV